MGQAGSYVFVIKPDMSVEYRLISPGARLEKEIVVEKGVSPGEVVVTDGQLRLTTGSLVRLVDAVDKIGGRGTTQ
jgi:multidrug efflux system membrane fusion protein